MTVYEQPASHLDAPVSLAEYFDKYTEWQGCGLVIRMAYTYKEGKLEFWTVGTAVAHLVVERLTARVGAGHTTAPDADL